MPTHKISSKSKLVLWALMCGTALTLPAPSFAQSADTEVEQGEILVTARRNSNMVILFVAMLLGRPDWGLVALAWWTVISLVVHAVRLAQAYAERRSARPIVSWMEG